MISWFHVCAVGDVDFHLHGGVKPMKYLLGHFHSGNDTFLLDEQFAFSSLCLGDAAQGGVVSVADVLGKCQVDEPVVEFFYA